MGPFKCPDCSTWFGYEHRCQPSVTTIGTWWPGTTTITWPYVSSGTVTIKCTCPPNRGDNYGGSCLMHDVRTWCSA